MVIDYYTLKLIWWLFVGVLLIGFALLVGFDLGVGTLIPFVFFSQRRVSSSTYSAPLIDPRIREARA